MVPEWQKARLSLDWTEIARLNNTFDRRVLGRMDMSSFYSGGG